MPKPGGQRLRLLVVLAVLAVLALAVRHYLAPKHPQAVPAPSFANPFSNMPIMNASEIVNSTNRKSLVGSPVHLVGVEVHKVDGDGAFWLGRFGETLLAVASPPAEVKVGERVEIAGSVQPSYRLDPGWLQQNLGFADTDTLRHFGVYIQADKVVGR